MRSPSEERACYGEGLAFIQASGFRELAAAAIAAVIPKLKARAWGSGEGAAHLLG
jgi:hypothetical protein